MSTNPANPVSSGSASVGSIPPKAQFNLMAKMQRYRFLLMRRWWILFLTAAIAVSLAAWNTISTPPKYSCSGRMMVSGRVALPGSTTYVEETTNYYGTQVELMQSKTVRQRAEGAVQTMHPELKQSSVAITVGQQAKTSIFIFQATGDQPEYTQELLNATMKAYIDTKTEMRVVKTDVTLGSLQEALKVLEKEIKKDEDDVVEFRKTNNINFIKGETNSAAAYLATIDNKLADLTTEEQLLQRLSTDQNIARQRQDQGRQGQSNGSPSPAPGNERLTPGFTASAEMYSSTKEEIQKLKAEQADFGRNLKPKHPIMVDLSNKIDAKQNLLAMLHDENKAQIADKLASVKIQIENLKSQREEWNTKALDMSGRTATYEALQSKLDRSKGLYERLLSSFEALNVGKDAEQDVVSILEDASLPTPNKPGMGKTIFTAIMGGVIVGLAILFLLDLLDDRLISISEFESLFTERILGRIPHEVSANTDILSADDDRHMFAESFSNLRSSVLYLPYDTGRPKTILVTSAVPNEGKSTISSNFAATLAFGGAKVLLIDCDLRRGNIRDLLGVIDKGPGFSEVIADGLPWRDAVKQTSIENLSLVPCGRRLAQPAKSLLSPAVEKFLKEVHQEYDYIVFDSCPVLAADDTTSLAPKLDAVVFIVRLGFTRRTTVRRAVALLYERQVNVLGVVLNDVNPRVDGYHYYSYSDYYGTPVPES